MSDTDNTENVTQDALMGTIDISKLDKKQLKFIEKISSTKFVLVFACLVLSTVLLWFGKIPAPIFSEIIQWTISAYIMGNAFIQSKWGK